MARYIESVSFDEKNFFSIVIDNGKLIMNPTKEDLTGANVKYYNNANICIVCRKENNITDKSILYPKNAFHNRYRECVCKRCYRKEYYVRVEKSDPNSTNNIIKSLADRRTGNLKDHSNILGDDCEEITKNWLGVKRLSIEYDKYSGLPYDHSPAPKGVSLIIGEKLIDLSGNILQTKGSTLLSRYKFWPACLKNEQCKKFDILILYCFSEDGNIIERVYAFPKDKVINITSISIYKNHSKSYIPWYEKYRIIDEDTLKKINQILRIIKEEM